MPRPRSVDDASLLPRLMVLFWRQGYEKTGIRELEAVSGLKAPSLYHRFGSKELLFQAALDHYLEVVVGYRIERYLKAEDPLAGLHAFFYSTYDYASGDQRALGCLLVNSALEFGASDAQVAAQLARGSRMIRAALRATLRRAQRAGSLCAEANPRALADALQLGLSGLLVSCRSEPNKSALRRRASALLALLPVPHAARRKD